MISAAAGGRSRQSVAALGFDLRVSAALEPRVAARAPAEQPQLRERVDALTRSRGRGGRTREEEQAAQRGPVADSKVRAELVAVVEDQQTQLRGRTGGHAVIVKQKNERRIESGFGNALKKANGD